MIDEKRFSRLVDMAIIHYISGREMKALKILQYLRAETGWHTDPTIDIATGFRNFKREEN
jgi:hypothetical protein